MSKPLYLIVACCCVALQAGCVKESAQPAKQISKTESAASITPIETLHYSISSTASKEQTETAIRAVEGLFNAYSKLVGLAPSQTGVANKMRIRLYADRAEFQANNKSRAWAEGYYYQGVCYAYFDASKSNPYHWLMHEAVHQLNREQTGFAKEKWLNEGLASYLGSSKLINGELIQGEPDPDAYPIWWLDRWSLSGNWEKDATSQKVIPLRALITGKGGPPLDDTVNAHYLAYWSLTHFLLHYNEGGYAAGYQTLLKNGGSLAEFERHIGPVDQVQVQWYEYLQKKVSQYSQ